jgi:hypothetical protein
MLSACQKTERTWWTDDLVKITVLQQWANTIHEAMVLLKGTEYFDMDSVALSPQSELYRLSDRHLPTKSGVNFCG